MSVSSIIRTRSFLITIFVLGIAHLIPLIPQLPLLLRVVLTLVATLVIPGYWAIRALLGQPGATVQARGEYALYTLGAGFGLQIFTMTLLSYLPGGITPWHTLAAFDVVVLVLMGLSLRIAPATSDAPTPDSRTSIPTIWVVGVALLLLTAGFFRFAHLGYAEYQGDEARAVLRAAAILQGHPETLFLHRKGPAEIVLTAVVYSLSGQLTEEAARLPFVLAGVMIPLAALFIGWRVHSPFAGWCAAMLLAIDGHFIGYGRIVQYHTIADLMSVLVILIGCRLLQSPTRIARYLLLAAFFTATGLLAHYEVLQIGIPLLFVLAALWRQGVRLTRIVGATVGAVIVGITLVALFYVPFVLSPSFGSIADYLSENLVEGDGGHFPYNHLATIFSTATFYSTTYFMVALVLLLALGIVALARQRWGIGGALVALGLLVTLCLGTWQPAWLTVNGTDLTILAAAAIGTLVVFTRLSQSHRLVWVWFWLLLIVAAFSVAYPSLHYIPTLMPLAILVGVILAQAYVWMAERVVFRQVRPVFAVAGVALYVVCALFAYRTFIENDTEFVRTWNWQPSYAWTLHDEVGNVPLFGVPHQSGWKTVGMLYAQGILEGTYDTNTRDWVAEWYSRRALRCERTHRYFILELPEQPWKQDDIRAELAQDYHLRGTITVNGDPRLGVYEVGASDGTSPFTVEERDFEQSFDNTSSYIGLDLDTPVIEPNPQYANRVQVDDHLWLEGYDLDRVEATAGDFVRVTMYWRVTGEIDEDWHTVADVVADDGEIEGELDREPGCNDRPTSRWQDGTLIVDHYEVPLFDDAAEGAYELLVGMYDPITGEPLSIYDDAGDFVGDMLNLAEIMVDK